MPPLTVIAPSASLGEPFHRLCKSLAIRLTQAALVVMAGLPGAALANFACFGGAGYLGVGSNGEVTAALSGQTAIHSICSHSAQGTCALPAASFKAIYATLLLARTTGKNVAIYDSNDALTGASTPSWNAVPSAHFVEGPNG